MESQMKKLLFIVNPRSGRTKSRAPLFDAAAAFSKAGYLVNVHMTEGPGDATRVAKELGEAYDLVVCSGGDGTLNETISGLMPLENRPAVGYLPNGSTNDFAASLHIPASTDQAAAAALEGIPVPLDIGAHNDRFFAYVASFGAFTRTSYSAPQATKNVLGHFAYILGGLGELTSLRPYHCRVTADGEVFEGDYSFGAVCNSTSLGGVMKLNADVVDMTDGLFEVVLFQSPRSPLDLQNLIVAVTSMNYDQPGIVFRHARTVTVETEEDLPWSLDGEYAPSSPQVEIRNLPGAIRLMLRPEKTT